MTYHPEYREYFATGILGGMNPVKCQLGFFEDKHVFDQKNETPQLEIKEINREMKTIIKVSPAQFKAIYLWMGKHLIEYEKRFGKIEHKPEDTISQPNFIS